jgi:hypothetical protein
MFDNLLTNARQDDDTNDAAGKPMMKTKTITKNYGTRLGKPTTKVGKYYKISIIGYICN